MEIEKISNDTVKLRVGGQEVSLDTEGLDSLLRRLAHVRADLRPEVPVDLEKTTTIAQMDPAWRTFPSLHPGAPGVALNLRHSGYGWVGFVLPEGEALNLGRWLVGHVERTGRPPQAESAPESSVGEAE